MLTVFAVLAVFMLATLGAGLMTCAGVERERGNTYKTEGRTGLGLIALAIALAFAL